MVNSLFNPTMGTHTQMRPTAQLRLQAHHSSSSASSYHNKFGMLPPSPIRPSVKKTPGLTRTMSSPSTTTAPMFPDEVLKDLYISDLETARAVLSPNYCSPGRPKIKYVLTLLDNPKEQPQVLTPVAVDGSDKPSYVLKLIKLSDYNEVNILQILPEACHFIRASLASGDGGVLVHCRKGISRSGSVIVAYLMQELGIGFDDALRHAKGARSKIWPNKGFTEQLRMWRDLNYTLVDGEGEEKQSYVEWKTKTRFRPVVTDWL